VNTENEEELIGVLKAMPSLESLGWICMRVGEVEVRAGNVGLQPDVCPNLRSITVDVTDVSRPMALVDTIRSSTKLLRV